MPDNARSSDPAHSPSTGEIRARVGQHWEDAADGWERWEPHFLAGAWPITQRMLSVLDLSPGDRVLDVGCGLGDPALSIGTAVRPHGSVLAIDLSPSMVAATLRRSELLQIDNIACRTGAAEDVSRDDGPFEAISARFSIMFMPDIDAGLNHLRSLLVPGGRIAVAAWRPHAENPMFAIPHEQVSKFIDLPAPDPKSPHPMRLAEDGELVTALSTAGFVDVQVEKVPMYLFAQTAEEYLSMIEAMSPTLIQALKSLPSGQEDQFRTGFLSAVASYQSGPVIRVPATAQVGWASV